MPIHEYKCRKCEAVVERIEGMHDRPMRKCPSCGGKVEQMISSSAFVLKGSGWYATDYGTKSPRQRERQGEGKREKGAEGEGARGGVLPGGVRVPERPPAPAVRNSTEFHGRVRRSSRRRGGAPLPYEMRSLGYPRRRKNGGHSEAGAQPCRFTARRATNGAPPSEATTEACIAPPRIVGVDKRDCAKTGGPNPVRNTLPGVPSL